MTIPEVVYLQRADKSEQLIRRRQSVEKKENFSLTLEPSVLFAPASQDVAAFVASHGPPSREDLLRSLPHSPTGWGHGGTRNRSTSRKDHTRSVSPAAIAGVRGCQRLAEPWPLVD